MTTGIPLTPQLENLVREQLATGRFHSVDEVMRTALLLLDEQQTSSEMSAAWLKQELDKGLSSRQSEPITPQFWNGLRDRLRTEANTGDNG